jgi:geranylgeranyl pyrophosphate synthase
MKTKANNMKKIHSMTICKSCSALLAAATLLLTGCSQEARDDAADTYEEAAETTKTIGEDTKEWSASTWQSVSNFTSEQRERFVENLEDATETANTMVNEFTESSEDVSEEALARYKEARDAMQEQLEAAAEAGDENWEETKTNVQEAWKNLKSATNRLVEDAVPSDDM